VWKDTLRSREWLDRCGESLLVNAWKWALEADPSVTLSSSEGDVLTPLTLTAAEAYHNALWGLAANGVPLGAIGVQARHAPCPSPVHFLPGALHGQSGLKYTRHEVLALVPPLTSPALAHCMGIIN
jgi:hypothetical protein